MLRIGIVGAGRVAQIAHLASFARTDGVVVLAMADLRPELARLVAERWRIPRVYESHRELIADPEIDAVVVVTQRSQTSAIAREALAAGKHVLSEKPMALSTHDAREAVGLARERRRVYAVGYMKRYDRGVGRARERIAAWRGDGSAGALLGVRIVMEGGDDRAGHDWLMSAEPRTDAGFAVGLPVADTSAKSPFDQFLNVFSHTTNLARFLVGERFVWRSGELDARSAALVGDLDGCPVSGFFCDRVVPGWHEQVEVVFERGSVSVALPAPFDRQGCARVTIAHAADGTVDCSGSEWAFAEQAAAFTAAVARGAEPLASGADAVEDVALAETFWRLAAPVGA